jgi:hypothetical protein
MQRCKLLIAIVAAGLVLSSCRPADPSLSMPGPYDAHRPADVARFSADPAAVVDARCEGCHEDVAAEQRASLHGLSWRDPPFSRAFAVEPLPFCQGCHAPEADPEAPVPEALAALGTGCVTCHVRGGTVLAAPLREGSEPERRAPHALAGDARCAGRGACAGGPEFAFPDANGRDPGERMQLTVSEHAMSSYATFPCADCHMPLVDGRRGRRRSHSFAASRDAAFVRSAAEVRAERSGPGAIRVFLRPAGVGHAFPTGDLFRRLTVSATASAGATGAPLRAERRLARHFGEKQVGVVVLRTAAGDDRVGVGGPERAVDLDLGAPAAPIHFQVRYERVEHLLPDGEGALVEGAIVVAEGELR